MQQRADFEQYLVPKLSEIYGLSQTNPERAIEIMQDKEFQDKLHAYGDSFAHVDKRGIHYHKGIGHLFDGTNPDNPYKNPEAYKQYVEGLSELIQKATGKKITTENQDLVKDTSQFKSTHMQKSNLADIGNITPDAGLKGCSGFFRICKSKEKTVIRLRPTPTNTEQITNE